MIDVTQYINDVSININCQCRFKLSHSGFIRLLEEYDRKYLDVVHPGWRNEDNEFRAQLWEVMHVFGPLCVLGLDGPFKPNTIIIEVENATQKT